jgi:hypothetical protein
VWKDKKPILFLSTNAIPVGYSCMPMPTVPRKNSTVREDIMTSHMHPEYTIHMHSVDVTDQLRASYNTQYRTHKWWHKILFFLLDVTILNMFIIYLAKCKRRSIKPISHLQFKVKLYEALL